MQPVSQNGAALPPLYARWMAELLPAALPDERKATCADCPMCEAAGRNLSDHVFDVETKCCTYWPAIPNFLAGAILGDEDPAGAEGRAAFLAALGAAAEPGRALATPLGVDPPLGWHAVYAEIGGGFGRRRELRCPYYLERGGGRCGIWRHRNARCATWFCRHERGAFSVALWKSVDTLLGGVERALARWCLLELDLPPDVLGRVCPPAGSVIEPHPAERLWGPWAGRERDFYVACARRVEALDWPEVLRIGGAETALAARLVTHALEGLAPEALPGRLAVGDWREARELDDEVVRVWTYNVYDPLDLSAARVDALRRRREGTLAEWRDTLQEEQPDATAAEDLLRSLIDHGILVPADGTSHPLT